jgi:hypothetical protein
MKSFVEHLMESKKTYKFKVKVAGDLPEGFADRLETNLKKYDLINISSGRKTPIQESPLDFPQLHNMEVTTYEVEFNYPATSHTLKHYLAQNCSIHENYIVVHGEFDPIQELQDSKIDAQPYETLLTKEDMGGQSAQSFAGQTRVMELLKELETARKERDIDPITGLSAGDSKKMDDKTNSKSPIGS